MVLSVTLNISATTNTLSNPSMTDLASQLDHRTRSAVDTSLRVSEVLSDDRIATVMGHRDVTSAGVMTEGELTADLEDDSTLVQLLGGLQEAQRKAILARVGQLGSDWTEEANKKAIDKATSEFIAQVTQPATARVNQAITAMNEASQVGIGISTQAAAATGAMTQERAEAIQEYTNGIAKLKDTAINIKKINIQIEDINKEIKKVLEKSNTELTFLEKADQTEKFNKLRKVAEAQRMAEYDNMVAYFNGRGQGYNGAKEFTEKDLEELTIPKGLKDGKGQDLIDNMIAWLRGRGKEFYAIIPTLLRVSKDLDAVQGIYWQPPSLQDNYASVEQEYRDEYAKQSKQLWHKLERLLTGDLKLEALKPFKYGLNNQHEFQCQEYDGVSAYYALLSQNRPQGAEYRNKLVKIFEAAPRQFADGDVLSKIEDLEPKLRTAVKLGVKLRWAVTGKLIALTLSRLDPGYQDALKKYKGTVANEDDCAAELAALFKDIKSAQKEIEQGERLLGKRRQWRAHQATTFNNRTSKGGYQPTTATIRIRQQQTDCRFGAKCYKEDCPFRHPANRKGKGNRKGGKGGKSGKGIKGGKGKGGECQAKGCNETPASERNKWCDACYEKGQQRGHIITKTGGYYDLSGDNKQAKRKRDKQPASDIYGFESLTKKQKEGLKQVVMAAKMEAKSEGDGSDNDAPGPASQKRSVLDRLGALESIYAQPAVVKQRQTVNAMLKVLTQ